MPAESEAPPFWIYLDGWLNERDWSQARFADEVGVHQTVVGRWLHPDSRRRARPSQKTLPRVAQVLGIPMQELVVMLIADQARTSQTDMIGRTRLASRSDAVQEQYERWIAAVGPGNEDYFWQYLKAQGDSTVALIQRLRIAVNGSPGSAVNAAVSGQANVTKTRRASVRSRLRARYRLTKLLLDLGVSPMPAPLAA